MKRLLLGSLLAVGACASSKEDGLADTGDAAAGSSAHASAARDGDAAVPEDTRGGNVSIGEDAAVEAIADAAANPADTLGADGSSTPDAQSGSSTTAATSATAAGESSVVTDATEPSAATKPFVTFTFDGAVYTVPADGAAAPENVSARIERAGGTDRWLVPSPSGSVFALSSDREDGQGEILVRASADFSVVAPVLAGGAAVYLEGMPAIVDAGDVIVFSASGGTHGRDLFVTREVDGIWSAPEELTTNSPADNNNQPSLTRDQTAVLFNCGQHPDPETGNNNACRVGLEGGSVEVVASHDAQPNNRNDYVNFPRETTGGIVFESAWPQGEDSPETIWQTIDDVTTAAVPRTFDNSVSPCVLPDDSLVVLWLGRPGTSGAHELTTVLADGSFITLWEGVDVADIGIGCTSR